MGDVLAAWEDAVGSEIARNAQPARFQRDGTLIVHCKDAIWGFELGHRAKEISERLPGQPALKFVPGPLPEAGPEPPPGTPETSPPTTFRNEEQAAEIASVIEDPDLRDLVYRAIRSSLG
jgi:hypothetical protein